MINRAGRLLQLIPLQYNGITFITDVATSHSVDPRETDPGKSDAGYLLEALLQ